MFVRPQPEFLVVLADLPVSVLATVAASIVYALLTYSSKYVKNGEEIVWPKLGRTVLVGVVVGVAAATTGQELSLANYETMAAAVGAVHIAERLWVVLTEPFRDRSHEADG